MSEASTRSRLVRAVGWLALLVPALHLMTDVMEWRQGGFSDAQLWLNYLAFLGMPWILPALWSVHEPKPGWPGLVGALLFGIAFIYFAHTTLYALAQSAPDYASLWQSLGVSYTVHGALMVLGGLLFGVSAWRAGWLPRYAIGLFLAGILLNAVLAGLPVHDSLQMAGSGLRNLGLMAMGWALLRSGSSER